MKEKIRTRRLLDGGSDYSCLVGVTGFEPAASTSQMSRATNCATPRYIKFYQRRLEKSSSTVVDKYRVKPQKQRFESAKNPVFMRVFKVRGLSRSLSPKTSALPTAPHLDIQFLLKWSNTGSMIIISLNPYKVKC